MLIMDVILLEEVPSLGNPGEIVKVKNGYARNYLLPRKIAVKKTPNSLKKVVEQESELKKKIAEINTKYQAIIDKLNTIDSLILPLRVGDDKKIFGSVTALMIAESLEKLHQITIDKRTISLKEQIKLIGDYTVAIQLNKDFKTELKIEIIPLVEEQKD